jgi:hypothetical protein
MKKSVWFGFFRHLGTLLMDFVGRAWVSVLRDYRNQNVLYVSGAKPRWKLLEVFWNSWG